MQLIARRAVLTHDTRHYSSGASPFAARPITRDLAAGVIAGAAATWLMNQVTTTLYRNEDEAAKQREEQARGGETAYAIAAGRLGDALAVTLDKRQRSRVGTALHWATGIGAGAAYAAARRRWPAIARGAGVPFGLGFFLAVDEGLNTALGFTPPPGRFPWQAHARGAAGHLVFGAVTHAVVRALTRTVPRVRRVDVRLSMS